MITVGMDLGSVYTKVSVLTDGHLAGYAVGLTGPHPDGTAEALLEEALRQANVAPEEVKRVVSTGYGRRIARLAHETISEISANAAGVRWWGQGQGIRTIIDIGGQDSKVIALDEQGQVRNFVMNDKCAAGTGRFLEVMADLLKVPLDEMGPRSLESKYPLKLNSTCVVYAKSEVYSLLTRGHKKEDLLAGLHRSIAQRIALLSKRVGIREPVLFDGGPARNVGLKRALEEQLRVPLQVPETPQIVTSIGAAVIAQGGGRVEG